MSARKATRRPKAPKVTAADLIRALAPESPPETGMVTVIDNGDPERIQGASYLDYVDAADLMFANYALAKLAEDVAESDDGSVRMGFACAQEIVAATLMDRMSGAKVATKAKEQRP